APNFRAAMTSERCIQAVAATDPVLEATVEKCAATLASSNGKVAHNENQAMALTMLELSRALDSNFYRSGLTPGERFAADAWSRVILPRDVAEIQHFWANNGWIVCPNPAPDAYFGPN